MLLLIQHSRIKVSHTPPQQKNLWDTNPRFQIDTRSLSTFYKKNIFRTSCVSSTNFESVLIF